MNQHNVWIKGNWFSAKTFSDTRSKLIKSGLMKQEDYIMQGYKPEMDNTGVLYSWKNMPIAYYDIPTLNNMVFSKKLWESIRENPFIKAALDNHCFWGEDCHRDSSEVLLENVVIRINDFWIGDDNLVLSNCDLMDTPKGNLIYSLAKTGMIGTSSRGFGDLIDIGNGLTRVDEDTYLAVSHDTVSMPAVPRCLQLCTSIDNPPDITQSVMDLETGLREQIASAIEEAYEKNPLNEWISAMYNSLHLADKSKTFPLASSLNFKQQFPKTKFVKNSFKRHKK